MLTSSPGARANVDVRYRWARNRGVCVDWLCLWVRRVIIGSLYFECVFFIVLDVSFLVLDLFFFSCVDLFIYRHTCFYSRASVSFCDSSRCIFGFNRFRCLFNTFVMCVF